MKRCNSRCSLLAAAAIGALLAWAPHRAAAQWAVYDAAGNAQWMQQTLTQIKTLAQQAQSYATQLQQCQTELNQYINMVTNTVALHQQVWSTVQSDIMRVRALSKDLLQSRPSGTVGKYYVPNYASQFCYRLRVKPNFATEPQMAAMAWTGRARSRSHRRNHGGAGSYGRSSIAGNAESDASSR